MRDYLYGCVDGTDYEPARTEFGIHDKERVQCGSEKFATFTTDSACVHCRLVSHDCGDPGPFRVGDRVRIDADPGILAPRTGYGIVQDREGRWYDVQVDSGVTHAYTENELAKVSAKRYPPPVSARVAPIDAVDPPPPSPLGALGQASYANASAKGFYGELTRAKADISIAFLPPRAKEICAFIDKLWLGMRLALLHSEVSEALEAVRDGQMTESYAPSGKPEGFPSELADVVIRLADTARYAGVDLDKAVREKMAYNVTRPRLHAKKAGV